MRGLLCPVKALALQQLQSRQTHGTTSVSRRRAGTLDLYLANLGCHAGKTSAASTAARDENDRFVQRNRASYPR